MINKEIIIDQIRQYCHKTLLSKCAECHTKWHTIQNVEDSVSIKHD